MEAKIYRIQEADLIHGCIRRDRAAQKCLYEMYSPRLYPLCCRYLKDPMEAEDVLVIGFTRILDKIEHFRGEGSLEGWMKRIMINEALTQLRKKKTMWKELPLDDINPVSESSEPGDALEEEDLLRMINELPDGYKTVFNLFAIDGYSHKEIAEQLNISENTSKSQLSRARTYLQKLMAERDHANPTSKHGIATR